MRRKVGRPEFRPGLRDHLASAQELLDRDGKMIECVTAIGVIRMNVREFAHFRPSRGDAYRTGDTVRRLDRRYPKNILWVRNDLVEQKIGTPVGEDRQQLK